MANSHVTSQWSCVECAGSCASAQRALASVPNSGWGGRYVNRYNGKEVLIKELYVKSKGILSLQKHHHRAEHWVVTHGKPKITLNKKYFTMRTDETIFIPLVALHRIENPYKKPVKIIEAQVGSILKETDIVRYQDVYGRVK